MQPAFDGRLSAGFIQRIYNNDETVKGAILQAVDVKQVTRDMGSHRWRIVLSDGVHFVQCMLSSQLHRIAEGGQLVKGSIVRLNGFVVNFMQNRRLVILLELDVIAGPLAAIGTPENVEGATGQAPAPKAPAPAFAQPAAPAAPVQGGLGGILPTTSTAVPTPQTAAAPPGSLPLGVPMPISGLSPYQNRWTIKGRVTQKGDIRRFNSQRGEGKLFNMELIDTSGEIRVTAFGEEVDKFYDQIHVGNVYYLTKATVKLADKRFSSTTNEYELTMNRETEICQVSDADTGSIPSMKYHFASIGSIEGLNPDTMIDVIGVVKQVEALGEITTKRDGRKIAKRDIHLVDQSNKSVKLTLWGDKAAQFNGDGFPILAAKGVRISDFGGRSLSSVSTSTLLVNPQIQEAFVLRGWYDQGVTSEIQSISTGGGKRSDDRWTIDQVQSANLGHGEKSDWFTITAVVSYIKKDGMVFYPACPNPDCNKKVADDGRGQWACEKCGQSSPNCDYRYVLNLSCSDHTGSIWLSTFNDQSLQIMNGVKASQMAAWKEAGDPNYETAFNNAMFQEFVFRCIAKSETYNGEERVKYRVHACTAAKTALVEESQRLTEIIEKYQGMGMSD